MAGVAMPAVPTAANPSALDATYWANVAAIEHAFTHTLASDQEALSDDKATYLANQAKLDAAEPTALTNIRNKANEEGLLTSGIEGQRTGLQQAAYTRSRDVLGTTNQQDTDKINRSMTEAGETRNDNIVREQVAAEARTQKAAEENAKDNPTLGAVPAAPAAPVPSGAPGLNIMPGKGTAQPTTGSPKATRKAAIKRAVR
jgi:hypothetical protein